MFKKLFKSSKSSKKAPKQKKGMSDKDYAKFVGEWAEAQEKDWVRERFGQMEHLMQQYAELGPQLENPEQRGAVLDRLAQDLERDCLTQEGFYLGRHDTHVAETAYGVISRAPEEEQGALRHKFQLDHPETLELRKERYAQLNDGSIDEVTRESIRREIIQEWMHQKGTTFPVPAVLALQTMYPEGQVLNAVEERMQQRYDLKIENLKGGMTRNEEIDAYHRNRNNRRKGVQGGLSRD